MPPFNNFWAQVVKVSDPPQIITTGIEVTDEFPNNAYSVGRSDFWTYAQKLFGLASPLPANVGLTGKGLAGTMDLDGDHFKVDGIPLTEFQDTAPTTPYTAAISPNTLNGCYQCHPGPNTQCLRDTMFKEGLTCIDCHGTLAKVSQNPNPWLNEPRCDTCHTTILQDQPLYRQSTGHKGIRCAACHDSPHAIAPTIQGNDAIKFLGWQGENGPLSKCTVCHLTQPTTSMPHGK